MDPSDEPKRTSPAIIETSRKYMPLEEMLNGVPETAWPTTQVQIDRIDDWVRKTAPGKHIEINRHVYSVSAYRSGTRYNVNVWFRTKQKEDRISFMGKPIPLDLATHRVPAGHFVLLNGVSPKVADQLERMKGKTVLVRAEVNMARFHGSRLAFYIEHVIIDGIELNLENYLFTMRGHTGRVRGVSFSPDGKRIVSGSGDKTLKLWDAATGEETLTLRGHTDEVTSVSFRPDGKRIVSGSDDKTLKLWDAATGEKILTLHGHTAEVKTVSFSPDGKRIVSGSRDRTLKVWDAQKGQELLTIRNERFAPPPGKVFYPGYGGPAVNSVSFSADGRRLASGDRNGLLRVWDAETGKGLLECRAHTRAVQCLSYSPNGKRLASAGEGALKVWDAATGKELWNVRPRFPYFYGVAFSPDGKRIASSTQALGTQALQIWDAATGRELSNVTISGDSGGVSFNPDGTRIASGSYYNALKVWKVAP